MCPPPPLHTVCSRLLLWRTEKAEVDGRFAIEDLEEWTRGLAREKSGHALRALRAMSSQLPTPPEAPPEVRWCPTKG